MRGPAARRKLCDGAILVWVLATACAGAPPSPGQESPGLGQPVPLEILASLDIDIAPSGEGLPSGQGSVSEGAALYATHCARCHGLAGEGGEADALVTQKGASTPLTVGSYWPYATTLFDYLRRAMPYDRPGSLDDDAVYAITAYLLAENQILDANTVLDRETLPRVVMPGRARFPALDPTPR